MRRQGVLLAMALAVGACFVDFEEFQYSAAAAPNTTSVGPGGGASGPGGSGPGGSGGSASGGSGSGASASSSGSSSGGSGVPSGVPGEAACGSASCDLNGGEICCVPPDQMGAPFCHGGASCPGNEAEMECDGPEDCNGNQDCCGVFSLFDGGYSSVSCQNNCNAEDEFILCASQADCDPGDTCQSSAYLPPNVSSCF